MFTNRLKEFRERLGISQVELACRAHVAQSSVNSIERGRLAPWPKIKKRLAEELGTTPEELFPEGLE
jgi:transcriptional regulator with XRE-family HTH domain